jgi:hypothetical protein
MEFAPSPPPARAMLVAVPLAGSVDLRSRLADAVLAGLPRVEDNPT